MRRPLMPTPRTPPWSRPLSVRQRVRMEAGHDGREAPLEEIIMNRTNRRALPLLALPLVVAAAACGGGDDDDAAPATTVGRGGDAATEARRPRRPPRR